MLELKELRLNGGLVDVYKKLVSEGYDVYSYTCESCGKFFNSLYWYENGRMLSISPEYFGNYRLLHVYISSTHNGSGSRLDKSRYGELPSNLLSFRNNVLGSWVKDIKNYKSIEHFLKSKERYPLKFFKVASEHIEGDSNG